MRDVEATRSKKCLLLNNKKQNTFSSENNLESTRIPQIHKDSSNPQGERVLESTSRKGSEIYQRNNRQKSEFLLISIVLKNIYRLKGLFESFVNLTDKKIYSKITPN